MKVLFTAQDKKNIFASQVSIAREIISQEKEEDMTTADYAQLAIKAITGSDSFEIFRPEAHITRNGRTWSRYFDGSEDIDIWLTFIAYSSFYGCYEVGCYISDLWELTGGNGKEISSRFYIKSFTK